MRCFSVSLSPQFLSFGSFEVKVQPFMSMALVLSGWRYSMLGLPIFSIDSPTRIFSSETSENRLTIAGCYEGTM